VFSAQGPTFGELCVQALSSVERGYDLLAPKFDHTPFRTPAGVLDATTAALAELGPFADGLDVCCGTGAGMLVLEPVCERRITGVDFSAGMLAQARDAHPDATWVRADARALPFADGFDLAVSFGAFGHFLPRERPAVFEEKPASEAVRAGPSPLLEKLNTIVLPSVNDVPQVLLAGVTNAVGDSGVTFPPVVLWRFRIASLAVQAITWTTLAIGFGFLATRVLERDSQQARDAVAVG